MAYHSICTDFTGE